jgi:hypothetical protein
MVKSLGSGTPAAILIAVAAAALSACSPNEPIATQPGTVPPVWTGSPAPAGMAGEHGGMEHGSMDHGSMKPGEMEPGEMKPGAMGAGAMGAAAATADSDLRGPSRSAVVTSCSILAASGIASIPATEEDWRTEYLAPILSIRVVSGLDEAIEHIERYGSKHTDSIITNDHTRAMRFIREVDSSSVMVNASTRFADGFEFGLGAEIGISTNKLHARGPVGLEGLTSLKYVVLGTGQIRT